MQIVHFRLLVVAVMVLAVVPYVLGTRVPSDPLEARLLEYDGYAAAVTHPLLAVVPLVVTAIACLGLLVFKKWARALFIAVTVIVWVASPLGGYRVSAPLDVFIGSVGGLLHGMLFGLLLIGYPPGRFD